MNETFPWPTGDESLFQLTPGSWDIARLDPFGHMPGCYASGYRLIVELALERALAEDRHLDVLVYPIFFNFRHYVELMLKGIIRDCAYVDSEGQDNESPFGHDIERLWRRARGYVENLFPDDAASESTALDSVEACLLELSTYDPRSTSFRYERDRDGRPSLGGLRQLDLARVQEIVRRVGNFFDCTDIMVSNAREWAQNCIAEVRAEMQH